MKPYNSLDKVDIENILDLYYKNVSYENIIKELDISRRALFRVLKEQGINSKRKNRYTLNESYFNKIDTEHKAYILGFIYADGYVGDEKHNNVVIAINEEDVSILEDIKKSIGFSGEIRRVDNVENCYKNSKPKVVLNFSSKKMAIDLRKLGLYPNKSVSMKKLPNIQRDLYRHFIRGYFDGDGSISFSVKTSYHILKDGTEKKYEYKSIIWNVIGTCSFLDDMKKYLPVGVIDAECKVENMKYLRTDSLRVLKEIYKFMYEDSTIYLKRKQKKFSRMSPDIK